MSTQDPTLTKLILDTMAELRTGMAELGRQQAASALSVEKSIRELSDKTASTEEHDELKGRVLALESTVSAHNRVVWILGIIGGICLAVATSVIITGVERMIEPRAPVAHSPQPTKE